MQAEQLLLPTIATLALGTALLVPLRDDRLGKRATLGGRTPLRPDFRDVAETATSEPVASEPTLESEMLVAVTQANVEADVEAPAKPKFSATLRSLAFRVRTFFEAVPKEPDEIPACDAEAAPPEDAAEVVLERSFAQTLDDLIAPLATGGESPPAGATADTTAESPPVPTAPQLARVVPLRTGTSARSTHDRIVPLTRMPLRPQGMAITWPQAPGAPACGPSRAERHAILARAAASDDEPIDATVLALAYREEDPPGRLLALRALARRPGPAATEAFRDALHVGCDDERSYAVDALLASGCRDAVAPAFTDRIDAIAASAALGYVASTRREDYLRELGPFVDRARIETLLALLAGVLE